MLENRWKTVLLSAIIPTLKPFMSTQGQKGVAREGPPCSLLCRQSITKASTKVNYLGGNGKQESVIGAVTVALATIDLTPTLCQSSRLTWLRTVCLRDTMHTCTSWTWTLWFPIKNRDSFWSLFCLCLIGKAGLNFGWKREGKASEGHKNPGVFVCSTDRQRETNKQKTIKLWVFEHSTVSFRFADS